MGFKALLVGINAYSTAPLKGCVSDVLALHELLQQRYAGAEPALRLLLDDSATKTAITDGLRWLAQAEPAETAPVRLFHFSGHGTYVADQNGDEPDGQDECIVPYDYLTSGPMNDDVLHELYRSFAPETHVLLTMDNCHSGTIERQVAEDIRYRFLPASYEEVQRSTAARRQLRDQRDAFVLAQLGSLREQAIPQDEFAQHVRELMDRFDKKHFGQQALDGNVVLLAACRADQTAADAAFAGTYHGAFSYALLQALRDGGDQLTYGALIDRIGRSLYESQFLQVPQLECSAANRDCAFLARVR
jgi:hypothetical protein